jgi:glycerol-3-phosphate acyltransferase PlsY
LPHHEIGYFIGSYLLGAIPFGFLVCYLFDKKDIRSEGSGNIGATNVLRCKGKKAGLITLGLDMLKGVVVILYGLRHFPSPVAVMLGGAAVILGHLFPIYLKFKGGKGVAALVGVFLIFNFPAAAAFGCAFLPVLYFSRYVSAGSIAGASALFFATLFTNIAEVSVIVLVIVILIIIKHRGNIRRMIEGTEYKFNWKNYG